MKMRKKSCVGENGEEIRSEGIEGQTRSKCILYMYEILRNKNELLQSLTN